MGSNFDSRAVDQTNVVQTKVEIKLMWFVLEEFHTLQLSPDVVVTTDLT